MEIFHPANDPDPGARSCGSWIYLNSWKLVGGDSSQPPMPVQFPPPALCKPPALTTPQHSADSRCANVVQHPLSPQCLECPLNDPCLGISTDMDSNLNDSNSIPNIATNIDDITHTTNADAIIKSSSSNCNSTSNTANSATSSTSNIDSPTPLILAAAMSMSTPLTLSAPLTPTAVGDAGACAGRCWKD